jgi:hypothetical protein
MTVRPNQSAAASVAVFSSVQTPISKIFQRRKRGCDTLALSSSNYLPAILKPLPWRRRTRRTAISGSAIEHSISRLSSIAIGFLYFFRASLSSDAGISVKPGFSAAQEDAGLRGSISRWGKGAHEA